MYFDALRFGMYFGHIRMDVVPEVDTNALPAIGYFYRRNKVELEGIAERCIPFLLESEPWKNPGHTIEFVAAFAQRFKESPLEEKLYGDLNLNQMVAERGLSLMQYLPLLLAFHTKVYGQFTKAYKESSRN